MSKIFLFLHTGSINRGCEAIVRSTIKLLNEQGLFNIYLISAEESWDKKFNLDKLCYYMKYSHFKRYSLMRLFFGGLKRFFGIYKPLEKVRLKHVLKLINEGDVVLFIGGDTYCYDKPLNFFAFNELAKKRGAKTVFFSCSVEKDLIDKQMLKDLNNYDFIFPREQITYNSLIECGIPEERVHLMSDTAFNLDMCEVSEYSDLNNTVGINISPIVIKNKKAYDSVIHLIDYILNDTNMDILFIPHVYDYNKQDDFVLCEIKEKYVNNSRVKIVRKQYNCEQLKFIISKCRFFVGARTHATIAAYSTLVPTLVLGYSVKSRGIARDLYDTEDGYAIMYDKITEEDVLTNAFINIKDRECEHIESLSSKMDEYKKRGCAAAEKIATLVDRTKIKTVYYNKESCSGCGACVGKCPQKAIKMVKDEKGFFYPEIDETLCINCYICKKTCTVRSFKEKKSPSKFYAAYSKNNSIVESSSSGGIFSEVAREIIINGGVVFGATFDSQFNVIHQMASTEKELENFKRSKYVQSDLKNTFFECREKLEEGKFVLYCGTPCQIGGLKGYLGKEYSNLITMDFICHGVPSPLAWRKYMECKQSKNNSLITGVNFRSKIKGWRNYSLELIFENGVKYSELVSKDTFLRGFIQNIILRDSCTSCAFKGTERISDITVADFWGIEHASVPDLLRNVKGVSAVILRTEKAEKIFSKIEELLNFQPVSEEEILKNNSSLIHSVEKNNLSDAFFKSLKKSSFDSSIKKYCGSGIIAKIRRKLNKF